MDLFQADYGAEDLREVGANDLRNSSGLNMLFSFELNDVDLCADAILACKGNIPRCAPLAHATAPRGLTLVQVA